MHRSLTDGSDIEDDDIIDVDETKDRPPARLFMENGVEMVAISFDEYAELTGRIRLYDSLARGIEDIQAGRYKTREEVMEDLNKIIEG